MSKKISQTEFEKRYAGNSDVSLEKLKKLGFHSHPCDCDYHRCQGWYACFLDEATHRLLRSINVPSLTPHE